MKWQKKKYKEENTWNFYSLRSFFRWKTFSFIFQQSRIDEIYQTNTNTRNRLGINNAGLCFVRENFFNKQKKTKRKKMKRENTQTYWTRGKVRPQTTSAYVGRSDRWIIGFNGLYAWDRNRRSDDPNRTTLYDGIKRTIKSRQLINASLST